MMKGTPCSSRDHASLKTILPAGAIPRSGFVHGRTPAKIANSDGLIARLATGLGSAHRHQKGSKNEGGLPRGCPTGSTSGRGTWVNGMTSERRATPCVHMRAAN
jgi:hypothetical protein